MSIQRYAMMVDEDMDSVFPYPNKVGSWVNYTDHLADRAAAVAAARREALEEAAEACAEEARDWRTVLDANCADAALECAAAIRALAQKEAPRE